MADYKVSLGAELRTKELDKQVKDYKGEINVKVNTNSIKDGIDSAINGYKPPKEIEVQSKLVTDGITSDIEKYSNKQNRKKITVGIDPDFTGVGTSLENYSNTQGAKALRVKVDINWTGVKGQIEAPSQDIGMLNLDAKLNDSAISNAIKEFNKAINSEDSKVRIKVKVDPDLKAFDATLKNHQPKPVKITPDLKKSEIDKQIGDYNNRKNKRNIQLKAKLADGTIEEAVGKYASKEVVPVKVDFIVGTTDAIDKKIAQYKQNGVDVPVRLMPAAKDFTTKIKNTPIQVSATVDKEGLKADVEAAVGGYTPTAKMPVNIKLTQPKDINAQVKSITKPTETIDVGVKLDTSDVNTQISLFQPSATLGVKPDLIFDNAEEEIRNYIPKEKIKVNLEIANNDINADAGKQNEQNPINVNVKLDPKNINQQIRDFKTDTKLEVGVKLDFKSHKDKETKEFIQKGIPQQIKEYTTKTKVRVGVELDRDSILQEINQINIGTPIRLNVELDPNGIQNVQNQIDDLRQRIQNIGNPPVNIGGNGGGNGNGNGNGGGNGGRGGRRRRNGNAEEARETADAYRELLRVISELGTLRAKLNSPSVLRDSINEINELESQIAELEARYDELMDSFEDRFTQRQQNRIAEAEEKASRRESLSESRSSDKEEIDERTSAYTRLMRVLRELGTLRKELSALDTIENPERANTLTTQIQDLEQQYNNMMDSIRQRQIQFTNDQQSQMRTLIDSTNRKVERNQSKVDDTAAAKNREKAYDRMLSTLEQIHSLEQNIAKLRNQGGNNNQITELEGQLDNLMTTYQNLMDIMSRNLTPEQWESLDTEVAEANNAMTLLQAKYKDVRNTLAAGIGESVENLTFDKEVKEVNSNFGRLSTQSDDARESVRQLNRALADMKTASAQGNIEALIEANERYVQSLRTAKNQIAMQQRDDKDLAYAYKDDIAELEAVADKIKKIKIGIAKLDVDSNQSEIDFLTNKLTELEASYQRLYTKLQGKLSTDQLSSVAQSATDTADALELVRRRIEDIERNRASGIRDSFSSYDAQIRSLEKNIQKLSDTTPEVSDGIRDIKQALVDMKNAADDDSLIKAEEKYQDALKKTLAHLNINQSAEEMGYYEDSFATKKEAALMKLNGLFEAGSQAAKRFGGEAEQLEKELNQVGNVKGIDNVVRKISTLDKKVKTSGLQTQTLGSRLKEQLSRYSNYLSIASVFMYAEQAIRSMFEQVKLVDSAMTELKKVTNETDASYNKFLKDAASRAKELGTTIDGLVASTADFARLGYGFKESQQLAEVANIYAVVGDEIEGVEDATQSLVSTMAAFKSEMNDMSDGDFAMGIVDKMNEVSNNFAISSGGIGQALQRSASSMAAANNSLDETIALITAANEVAQNPEKVGNAMKTISMRIRGAKTELEEAGESTDGMAESTASLRQEMLALSGVDIMLDKNTFKSTYQIMDELSTKWKDLTDIQRATITELVAGKHQGNIMSSLMANFQTARDALTTSLGASEGIGSAMKEHAKWSESLEARLNKLKATWQSLSQTFLNSDFLKVSMDLITGLVNILDKLIGSLGSFGAIGLSLGITGVIKNFGTLKTFAKDVFTALTTNAMDSYDAFTKWDKASNGVISGGKKLVSSMSAVAGTIGLVVAAIGLAYNAYKKSKEAAAEARQETIRASDEYLDAATSFERAYIKYSGKTELTADEEAELASAIDGTVNALGDKSSALQSVVNGSNDYLASLEQIADAEIKAAERAAKAKRDAAEKDLKEAAIGWGSSDGSEVDIKFRYTEENKEALDIAKEMGSEFYDVSTKRYGKGRTQRFLGFELSGDADVNTIIDYYNTLLDYQERLSDADLIDTDVYDAVAAAIDKMSESVGVYVDGTYEAVRASKGIPKTVEEFVKMREAILGDDDIKNLSFDAKLSIANTFDSEYGQLFDLSDAEVQARKFVGLINGYDTDEVNKVETFINLRTAVNDDEKPVGEYLSELNNIKSMTSSWGEEERESFNTSFGIDGDTIKAQYDDVLEYISRKYTDYTNAQVGLAIDSGFNPIEQKEFSSIFEQQEYARYNKERIQELLNSLTASELAAVVDIKAEIDWQNASVEDIRKQIEEQVRLNEAMSFTTSIDVDKTSLEAFNTALSESASAMGLTEESIDSLKSKYSDLKGYNPHTLFEKTANGVKVNREEVAKLGKEYNDLKKTEVQRHLDTLVDEYNKCTKAIDSNIGSQEKLELITKREKYAEQIEELAEYQSQLEGVTGAYQRWIDAQNTPEDYEGYQAVATSRKDIKDEIKRGFISNASKEYIDLLSGKDLTGGTIDDYANAWEKLDDKVTGAGHSIHDFFTVNDDGDITATGIDRFFKSVQKDFEGSIATFDEKTQKWQYNFSQENLQKIQDEWGMGIEAIELLLEAAASAGYDVDWGGIFDNLDIDISNFESVEAMISLAEKAQEEFNKLDGVEDVEFNFRTNNVEEATTEVEKARKAYLDLITNEDGSINLKAEGAEQMQFILSTLLTQKQQLSTPAIMKVDTSQIDQAETDIIDVINKAQALQKAYENYEIAITTGVDVEGAKKDLNSAIDGMKGTSVDVRADLKLPTDEELETAKNSIGDIKVGATLSDTAIGNIASKIQTECTPEVIAKVTGLDESSVASESHQVVYTAEHKDVDDFINSLSDISKKIIYKYTTEGTKPNPNNIKRTITYEYKTEGDVPEAYGTAHSNGTASGRAFARGNWGIKGNGVALGGELGQELVVRDGKFFTIGDSGAEFFKYKNNDIIFNAAQTESLFKYGGIKGAKPRGKMLATGSAFADGSAASSGRAFWQASASLSKFVKNRLQKVTADGDYAEAKESTSTKSTTKSKPNLPSYSAKVAESDWSQNREPSSSGSSSSSSSEKEFEESFDWIEIAISRLERAIDNLDKKANNVYKSWSDRNSALSQEIGKVGEEIKLQEDAAQRYLKEANSVGLSASYAEQVRNGTIDIQDFEGKSDEALVEKIKDYQTWYEKYLACIDAAEELRKTESELYAQRFENVQTQYDAILQGYEHTEAMLNEYINQAEEQGYIVSRKYYDALIKNEKSNIAELQREQADLIAERDNAVEAGKIVEGSEAWYEQCAAIDEVTQAIEEANTSIIEYNNSIRDIDWQIFDIMQERISGVTAEADFLIELMSNKKLFDDDGKLTSQGLATMGLHTQNYNTHMYQADTYGEEVSKLNGQIAKDPYNQELINRRNELLELQRESILAAEGEKDAIRDMVEEGINLELDALQERIDLHNEELDSMKDLYDYQKRVEESSKNIASLRKQLSAYEGFDDEETRAKVQELKVSLEEAEADLKETEYDKYISDQQALLDTLYNEYELILNTRLDNVDYLLESVIDSINIASSAEGVIATALGSDGAISLAIGNNATSIKQTLTTEANKVGTTLSSAMNNIWSVGSGNAKSILTMYGDDFKTKSATIITTLNGISASVNNMVTSLNKDANKNTVVNKTITSAKTKQTDTSGGSSGGSSGSGDGKPKVGDKVTFISGQYYYDSYGTKPIGDNYRGKEVYITKIATKSGATHPYHIASDKSGKHPLGWLKLSQISGYALGKQNFLNDEIAWTQEGKKNEFIIRPSDGAILTPIAKGDSVLNAMASNNIWDMANSPTQFIRDNLGIGAANVPNSQNVNNNITQHFDNITFSMPNVHGYNDLLTEMQKDPKFEKLVLSMTIDRIAGRSSLAKGKSIR